MTKAELVSTLAQKVDLSKSKTEAVLNNLVDIIVSEIQAGRNINITNLGTFSYKENPPRKGRHPVSGEPLEIPAQSTMRFKPSKAVRRVLNEEQPVMKNNIDMSKSSSNEVSEEKPRRKWWSSYWV